MGLGPGSLTRVPAPHRLLLEDPTYAVVVRTLQHPAARELAARREIEACDDLYEDADRFEDVYGAIAERVLARAALGPTIYAVPGSPMVGEFAVGRLIESTDVEVVPGESFIDAILRVVGYDPLDRGLRVVNGHELPDPLFLDSPSVIGHLDRPEILADVSSALSRVLPEGSRVTVTVDLGSDEERVEEVPVDAVPAELAGLRTSLFVDAQPAGLAGLIAVSRRLREECPWDRQQTHHTLVRHLLEETHELVDAIAALPGDEEPIDFVAYDGVEEELGDVLLQVLFHSAIASEKGAFGIDDVASRLREKLVRRHPHVFGNVVVADADEVASNWEDIKAQEKETGADSVLAGVPDSLPALSRAEAIQRKAARVGFDWDGPSDIVAVLRSEVEEVGRALGGDGDPAGELGDVLFTVVNLLRHLDSSGEEVLRQAVHRFERRFRRMEESGPLAGLSPDQLEASWQAAKRSDS